MGVKTVPSVLAAPESATHAPRLPITSIPTDASPDSPLAQRAIGRDHPGRVSTPTRRSRNGAVAELTPHSIRLERMGYGRSLG
jgi:hypothetical protein